jgi:tryptophan 2,3-dioxygenase
MEGSPLTYSGYLRLDELLTAQRPLSDRHDELLFIVIHQASELWFKLALHELRAAAGWFAAGDHRPALKAIARVKAIQRTLTEQWSVLATMTPTEYAQFRDILGPSSGFQSVQYRELEESMADLYAAFNAWRGDVTVEAVYADPEAHWEVYEACEELVDLEENFMAWRFRHLKTVERLIGHQRGTGGTSGVEYLRKALDRSFFPELYAVRDDVTGPAS